MKAKTGLILVALAILTACSGPKPASPNSPGGSSPQTSAQHQLNLFVGSEQEATMQTIVQPWCQTKGWDCQYRKKGSVDQKTILQSGTYQDSDGWQGDGFWFASSVWPTIGDTKGVLRDKQSMYVSPTVYATWKHIADANGWSNKPSVPVLDIFNTAKNNGARIWWSNPSQSNSGATGYLSLLTALAGNAEGVPLTIDQINDSALQQKAQDYVRLIDHSSPSTKDVTDGCIANKSRCDGVFTYESTAIQEDLQLVANRQEPLIVIYPREIALNDSYLTFVPNGPLTDATIQEKEKFFLSLQAYLQTPDATAKILAIGWRAGSSPLNLTNADPQVFNPSWGIQKTIQLTPIAYPSADALNQALSLYQTSFRRPVDAIYCLDTSGSMGAGTKNSRWSQVSAATKDVFVKSEAERYQLLTHPQDITQVLFFADSIAYTSPIVTGDDYTELGKIYNDIAANTRGGGTNIYGCAERALDLFKTHPALAARRRVIFMMTDGQSDGSPNTFKTRAAAEFAGQVTLIAIGFSSEADGNQLHSIADPTEGTVIFTDQTAFGKDSRPNKILATDFAEAMKNALGYK